MDDRDDDGQSTLSVVVPVKVTRFVKRSLEEGFVLMNSKKPHCSVGKTSCNVTPIDILDDSSEFERPSRNKEHPSSKSLKKKSKRVRKKCWVKSPRKMEKDIGKYPLNLSGKITLGMRGFTKKRGKM
ncbi:hypothetical protein MTR67_034874 [Solanum verrucosum]|uniref:Uncharacterized protein n=1 Tax=Solanum verrucosum TaxID=315347 RepID=A0AAF0U9C9_SOLVR|nr:hypothetical protein MTR67_034874 [Solanum verrucosum]